MHDSYHAPYLASRLWRGKLCKMDSHIRYNLDDEPCCGQGCSRCLTKGLSGEFVGGKLDGAKLHLCEPLDCQCGRCEVE
jgi:hypothetical protein